MLSAYIEIRRWYRSWTPRVVAIFVEAIEEAGRAVKEEKGR